MARSGRPATTKKAPPARARRPRAAAAAPSELAEEQRAELDALAGGRILNEGITAAELHDIDGPEDHPDNPRDGDVGAIAALIQEHGWYGRLVVQVATPDGEPRNRLLVGHHRRRAAKALGYVRLPMERIVCSDRTARKILLADNRSTDLASYRKDALAAVLQELAGAEDLAGTGYTGDDLDELLFELRGAGEETTGSSSGDPGGASDPLAELAPLPARTVAVGDVWALGDRHVLLCCDVFLGWPEYRRYLKDPEAHVFCPFPGPFVAVSSAGERNKLVLVQPDPALCGHILDQFAAVHGAESLERLDSAGGPCA